MALRAAIEHRGGGSLTDVHYHGNVSLMASVRSKVTAQGQISVPAEIRQKLGVGPGSVLEWAEVDEQIVVRRSGQFSSEEIHGVLFPDGVPAPRALDELKEGIRKHMRKRREGR
jgi:AbrB family looped-hinge helix DNA binding protein